MTNKEAIMILESVQPSCEKYSYSESEIYEAIDVAISALAERKRGEWRELTNAHHTYICSVCGRMLVNISDGKNNVAKNYPFCHCGADMRGETDDADANT